MRFYYEFHSFLVKEKPNIEQMKSYLEIRPKEKVGEKQSKKENIFFIFWKIAKNWMIFFIKKQQFQFQFLSGFGIQLFEYEGSLAALGDFEMEQIRGWNTIEGAMD